MVRIYIIALNAVILSSAVSAYAEEPDVGAVFIGLALVAHAALSAIVIVAGLKDQLQSPVILVACAILAGAATVMSVGEANLATLIPISLAFLSSSHLRRIATPVLLAGTFVAIEVTHHEPVELILVLLWYGCSAAVVAAFTWLFASERAARQRLTVANRTIAALSVNEERTRIAHELHDSLGHHLTVAHLHLQCVAEALPQDPVEAENASDIAREATEQGLEELRTAVRALSSTARAPLDEALVDLAKTCETPGTRVQFASIGERRSLAPRIEDTIYRVAREALTNAVRHANAGVVSVELNYRPEQKGVELTVSDNGSGADSVRLGFGLRGVLERAQTMGGEVTINAVPAKGFTVKVGLPA